MYDKKIMFKSDSLQLAKSILPVYCSNEKVDSEGAQLKKEYWAHARAHTQQQQQQQQKRMAEWVDEGLGRILLLD